MSKISQAAVKEFKRLLKQNLYRQIVYAAAPKFIDLVMDEYENQLYGFAPEDDPTAPEKLKEQFQELLERTVQAETRWEGDKLKFKFIRLEDLGYGEPPADTEKDLLKTFIFILEGIMGEYAWVGEEFYQARASQIEDAEARSRFLARRSKGRRYGRAGQGYLISKERWNGNENWAKFGPFEQFRWGFSNQGQKTIFEDAGKKIKFETYIEKAIDETIKQMRAKGYGTRR